ncbi:GHKL domain-containing protein [Bacillus sp. FJAT-42376]|uniref:ATP-binding protein n=1 Tax=Bacillus sp. FJAT-42376 TaxID=2014076 RepID=UPI000F4F2AE4|nr:sensor histidine kinase [Bacillus sp. FJAT-42376]AZB44215.1 GHKL domain-containing protein [Bacillus sp. FJAT-42376]
MENLKDLILQVTFILFPIYLYQALWLNRPSPNIPKPNLILIYLLCSLSSIMCMIFPIYVLDGIPYGLHYIPYLAAVLYGGPLTGISVAATGMLYRLYSGGDIIWLSIIVTPLFLIFPLMLHSKWNSFRIQTKLSLGVMLSGTKTILTYTVSYILTIYGFPFLLADNLLDLLLSFLLFTFVLLLTIYCVNSTKENAFLRARLIKSEKLSIVSELAASVAHEVRNPLTVVRGFIQLIGTDRTRMDPKNDEYISLVLSELDRAQEIITDYLNLAKQQYFEKNELSLSQLLDEVVKIMTSYANYKNVHFKNSIAPNLYVYGDAARLKQVFLNLLKNSVEAVSESDGEVKISAYSSHEFIRIKIKDNGIGMTPEQLERIGEPYFTLKERGTGLGLTVTFSIVEQHDGTIRFKSEPGAGTSATVSLPICELKDRQASLQ